MATVSLGDARHERSERRFGQPLGNAPTQDPIAKGAFSGDDQRAANAAPRTAFEKGNERVPGVILAEAVQINTIAKQAPRDAPQAPRFDGLRF